HQRRRRLASKLCALVGRKSGIETCNGIRRDAPQSRGVAVDRGNLGNHGLEAPVGCTQNNGVTAGVTRSPEADTIRIHLRPLLKPGNRATPIADLLPGIDVLPRFATAIT